MEKLKIILAVSIVKNELAQPRPQTQPQRNRDFNIFDKISYVVDQFLFCI